MKIASITPAYNEEEALPGVLNALREAKYEGCGLSKVIVVDNGSTDCTAQFAREHGAHVVPQPERGYGAACLAGMQDVLDCDIVVFVDGDGSDYAEEWPILVDPIIRDEADLVIGSRVLGKPDAGALSPHQRFGNWLATRLLHWGYGAQFTDLGPFRAIRVDKLKGLRMRDRDYGWTIEMQLKAVKHRLRYMEVPVRYRRRQAGQSKISGSVRGSFLAGKKILQVLFRDWAENLLSLRAAKLSK